MSYCTMEEAGNLLNDTLVAKKKNKCISSKWTICSLSAESSVLFYIFFPIPWMIIGLSFPGSAINADRETSACAHTVPSTYKDLQCLSAILMSVPNLSLRRAQLLLPPESLPWPLSSGAKCSQRVLRTPLSTWHISLEWFDSHPTNHTSLYTGFLAFTLSAGASPLLPLNDC